MKALVLVLFIFIGCIEEPIKVAPQSVGSYSPEDPVLNEGDQQAMTDVSFAFTPNFGSVLSGYRYSATALPTWASLNMTTGEITGVPTKVGQYLNIVVTATNGSDSKTFGPFSIGVNGDPLYKHAWHLKNTGQNNFATLPATVGQDANISAAFKKGYTGNGVKVVVSDSGVELNHDDLNQNALTSESKDYSLSSPYFGFPKPVSPHGTAVSGIITARGWNNIGGRGVAPKASLIGYQFLKSSQSTSILIDQASGAGEVFNYSYGDAIFNDFPSSADYLDQVRHQATVGGRSGKGSVFIKSAGNEFELERKNFLGVSKAVISHNANSPMDNESPFMIVVGALDADGDKAFYSNTGSNLWITAPGGHFGVLRPAILTTDLPGCLDGYARSSNSHINDFEYGHAENINCHYTSQMNGTSAATPIVSGAVALLLEANPSLTMRDVKHILAKTAKKVSPTYNTKHPTPEFELAGHQYEQGWVTNAAGYSFSNWFGFGALDISAAVAMATDPSYQMIGNLVELNEDFNDNNYQKNVTLSIPDADASGAQDSLLITNSLTVESVQISVDATHNKSGELGFELTSPSGTKSILFNINNSYLISKDKNLDNHIMTSHAFYGESSRGVWKLKVIDGMSGNTGSLTSWKINILGH